MAGINLKNNKNFIDGMRLFEEELKVDPEFVIQTLKEAIVKTYQKHIEAPEANVRVEFDNKELKVYHQLKVVDDEDETFDETLDILLADAKAENPEAKIGDIIEHEVDFKEISRSSINVTKQMLKQKIREYGKQRVYDEFKDRQYDLISGIVKTVEDKFCLIDLKSTIGILLKNDQIPGEVYREGQSIKTIIKEVNRASKGSQVVLSRSDAMFVKRLFEKEVPEIQQGIVEIKAIAREAGERTKMAVFSGNDEVDAIGACIGPRGSRVQVVIGEIKGEKIDVFEWNEDIGELVKNALAPAEVKACFYSNELINPELTPEELEKYEKRGNRPLVVVVEDDKLSIAIGKKGKNAKLAVKLTNRKIDIKTESEINELGIDVEGEVATFREDQARIIKEREQKKFLELQEEAMKRNAEFKAELESNDTGMIEEAFEEMETKEDEVTIVDIQNEEKALEEEEVKETKASKKEEKVEAKKHKKKADDDRRVRAENLEKKEYGEDVKPIYSDEELEEIKAQEEAENEDSWINDDEVDFDEYDEYYDEEK